MPKTALQRDRTSSQWQTTFNNTCTGSVHPNITPAGQVQDDNNNCPSYTRNTQSLHQSLWAQTHRRWTRQDWKKCSSLMSHGFVSPWVMVGFAFMIIGMSVTPRPVLWSGIDLEVEGPSWSGAVSHSIIGLSLLSLQIISTLCITGTTSSSLMWYTSCRLILT